jgi:hypothetical protein
MEIIDCKAAEVSAFIASLDRMLGSIQTLIKNRSPHPDSEKYLTNRDVCRFF